MANTTKAATPLAPPVAAPMSVEQPVATAPLFDDSLMESLGDLAAAELEAVADAAIETSRQAPAIEAASEPLAEAVEEPVHVEAADIVKPIEVAVEAPAPRPAVVQNVAPIDARRPVPKTAAAPAPAKRSAAPPKGWADRIVGVAAVLLVIAGIGLGAGAYWMKVQG